MVFTCDVCKGDCGEVPYFRDYKKVWCSEKCMNKYSPVIPFDFDQDMIIDFTDGYCNQLAIRLKQSCNGNIFGISESGAPRASDEPLHYVVSIKNNYYVDIRGIWKEKDIKCLHQVEMVSVFDT